MEEKEKSWWHWPTLTMNSFGMGGTLALYARQGAEVHLICATRGEAGEVDPQFLEGFDSIAERREDELRCAAQYLGLQKYISLNTAILACRGPSTTSIQMDLLTPPWKK